MGCGSAKEKIENEIIKAKMERNEIQYEREQQMKLLNELGYNNYKPPVIPDYILPKMINSKNPTIKKKKMARSHKSSKSLNSKRKRIQSFSLKKKTSINSKDTNSDLKAKTFINQSRKMIK